MERDTYFKRSSCFADVFTHVCHSSVLTGWQRLLTYAEVIRWQRFPLRISKHFTVEHIVFVVNVFDVNAVLWRE